MSDLTVQLPSEMLERLQSEAERRSLSVDVIVSTALERYFEDDEQTKEEILEDLRISLQQALAGEVRPAREVLREVLDEIEHEMPENADKR